jgi:GT2 family glycosyltransferase
MNSATSQAIIRVFAVIVLYGRTPAESRTFQSLQEALRHLPPGHLELKILLYDNTPGGQDAGVLPSGVEYKADVENGGLAAAYNYALERTETAAYDWLLTLDQDTGLPSDFLIKLGPAVAFASTLGSVGAVVPCLFGGGRPMSPWVRKRFWIRPARLAEGYIGIPQETVFAANSVSTVRVSALKSIGRYDPRFYLWASDLVLYSRLRSYGFKVFVAGNIHVDHEVSILDLKRRSTPARYEDMLRADEAFFDEYMGTMGHLVLLLTTLHRMFIRIWSTGGGLIHFRIAFRFLCRGLFFSRKRRMESWDRFVVQRGPARSISLPH